MNPSLSLSNCLKILSIGFLPTNTDSSNFFKLWGLSFILFLVLAKYINTDQLGIFFIFYSTLMISSSLFEQGVTLTTIHFFNHNEGKNDFLKTFFVSRILFLYFSTCNICFCIRFNSSSYK